MVSLPVNCQNDSINKYDELNRKQGYWIHYFSENHEQVKKEEGSYLDDIRVGTWIFYYPDGKSVKAEGQFKDGEANGPYTKFYDNGKLKEIGVFYNSKYYGDRKKYHENGQLEQQAHFDDSGAQFDTTFNFYFSGEIESKKTLDTANHIITEIYYNEDGTHKNTKMMVIENQRSFSIVQIAPNLFLDSSNTIEGNYHYKLTFEGTPIFREFLLIIHEDSTYEVFKYIYESCYNYIEYSKGTWTLDNKRIHLNNNSLIPSELMVEGDSLISKKVKEIDDKKRVYNFKKISP